MKEKELQQALKEYMRKIASKGGKKTLENKGKDHFRNIVKARWAKQKAQAVDKSVDTTSKL